MAQHYCGWKDGARRSIQAKSTAAIIIALPGLWKAGCFRQNRGIISYFGYPRGPSSFCCHKTQILMKTDIYGGRQPDYKNNVGYCEALNKITAVARLATRP